MLPMGTAKPKPQRMTAAERLARRRDRHGWRTAAKRNKFGEPTKAAETAAAKRHESAVKAETRAHVWRRAAACEACGDSERQTAAHWHKAEHECHEVVPRSLTRGLPPEIRFSTENSARVCGWCHFYLTRHQIEFDFHSDLKMDGPVTAVFKDVALRALIERRRGVAVARGQ